MSDPAAGDVRERQIRQAEELLFSEAPRPSFAKELFHGRCAAPLVLPYPQLTGDEAEETGRAVEELRGFCDEHLDPDAIDRQADIPREVIDGLGQLGVLGMTAPVAVGGRGFSQLAYCRVLEELGSRCSSTSIFVNAHHSIGMRGLLLFGTDEQQQRWLPDLISGRALAAFALTEPEAGSDAANVQTTAIPSEDGSQFLVNGQKRYITNGAIADVFTVMAKTPVASDVSDGQTAVTAFLVTPDMPGFTLVEPRMEKLGIRGTTTSRLAFENMPVPRQNMLGPAGGGLKVALTVLDFGRTTFGACCTGTAKTCLALATAHARTRRQFGRTLGEFPLIQKKIARMSAATYAMEAMTTVTAGLIDGDLADYMVETAMLKVFSTECLWTIVNDAFQIHGGAAYFTDNPLERILRDARINQIGEGANEVLTSFISLVGLRGPGEELRQLAESCRRPWTAVGPVARFLGSELHRRCSHPGFPVESPQLAAAARTLGRLVRRFANAVQGTLIRHREEILERQLVQEPLAQAAIELYASACVLSRRDAELSGATDPQQPADPRGAVAALFLKQSARRIKRSLAALADNDDAELTTAALQVLVPAE